MNEELRLALDMLEKEKKISKQALIEAIELSLQTACKNHFGSADNVHVSMNPDTAVFSVLADKTSVWKKLMKWILPIPWEMWYRCPLIPSPSVELQPRMPRA